MGIGLVGLLSLFGSAAVFLTHLLFNYDIVNFRAVPILLASGISIHAFAALVALIGVFIRTERRLLCGISLVLNLVPPLIALAVMAAGLVLISGGR